LDRLLPGYEAGRVPELQVGVVVPARISEWQVRYYERWTTGERMAIPYLWVPSIGEWVLSGKAQELYNPWYGTREKAESDALLVAARWPGLIGQIEVVEVVHCLA
jgi:hypothetical protein